jgi:hypothetical protein
MTGEAVWTQEFPPMYKVPHIFSKLAEDGIIEDMSWRNDPCPSFGAKLPDKNFVRIWVEHPMKDARKCWPTRFTILVQPDLNVPFGRRILATDYLNEAYGQLLYLVRSRGILARQGRFKVSLGTVNV